MAQIALTESKVMEAWKPGKGAPLYRKSVVLEIVGKSGIILTKNSAFQHVFLSNGKNFYRLIVWKEKLDEAAEKLKLQSVVRFSGIKVEVFFYNEKDIVPIELCGLFQFVCMADSKLTVLLKKTIVEYPKSNLFPPFWKMIKNLALNDSEIAMRALLLSEPMKKSIVLGDAEVEGNCAYIGDESGFKILLFVGFDVKNQDEKEIAEELQANVELLLGGGKIIRIADEEAMLMVTKVYFLKIIDDADKKLTRFENYEEVTLANPPSVKKARRSDFF